MFGHHQRFLVSFRLYVFSNPEMFAFWDVWLAFSPFNSPNNQGKGCLSEVYASCPRLHCSISSYFKTGFVFLFFLKNHWLVTLNIFYVPFCLHFDDLVSNCIIGSVAADGWWGKKTAKYFFSRALALRANISSVSALHQGTLLNGIAALPFER